MVVQHNMSAADASRQLKIVGGQKNRSIEKLSSGYRINRAADDAAGLAISEKMRWQKRGLDKASFNAGDGISFIQTAEGALSETHSMLDRMKELMTQAANDTNTPEDRKQIQLEIDQLTSELDRVSSTTKYNTLDCFSKNGLKPDSISNSAVSLTDLSRNADGTYSAIVGQIEVTYSFIDSKGQKVSAVDPSSAATGTQNQFSDPKQQALADDVVRSSSYAVAKLQANFPTLFAKASTSGVKVGLDFGTSDGKGNTLASAVIEYASDGTNTSMTYHMNVDTTDYTPGSYNADSLHATVAHEMTHLVMYDTLTNRMIGADRFPKWFIEGMAQTTSGDGGWFTLNSSSDEASIKQYMSQADTAGQEYGAGYLACMYLGYAASGSATVDSTSIRTGLDKVLGELADNKSLDDVVKDNTSYTSLADFLNGIKGADQASLDFTKKFIAARGADGAGSITGELSDSQAAVFGTVTASGNNYTIEPGTTRYQNNVQGAMQVTPPSANPNTPGTPTAGSGEGLMLQVGALSGQAIKLQRFDVSSAALLGGETLDTRDNASCGHGMALVEDAIERTSKVRSYYGALQNRLEHAVANLDNTAENTDAAESRIRDTDMAKEMTFYSMQSILEQAGQSMLAQTNQITQGVLTLLR